jgi:zinc protease
LPLIRTLSLGFALIFAASAHAKNEVTTFTLDNGLEGVVIEDHRSPTITHMLWYRAGAADEPPGKSGVAHFLEHLMFKSTDELASGEFSRIVAANGGTDNAFTSYDYTGYFQRISADRLELVMKMEADRMVDLELTEEQVAPELQVVLEERNQRTENDPGALFSEQRNAALYLNHPYATPIIGWKHEILTLTRQDALDWYDAFYAPNNAILVVAGDVDPAEVEALAKKHFGPLPPSDRIKERSRPQEPPHLSERRLKFFDERVRQPYVVRTYLAPERDPGAQKTAAALTILAELLGGSGITSVMGEQLQLDEKLAIATGAFYSGLTLDNSSFGLYVVPAQGKTLEEAEDGMDRAIASFIADGPDPDHLKRIKNQIYASTIYEQDDQAGLARLYGAALTSGLTVQDVQDWPEILASVEADDVIDAARLVFDKNNSVTGWLMQSQETTQ